MSSRGGSQYTADRYDSLCLLVVLVTICDMTLPSAKRAVQRNCIDAALQIAGEPGAEVAGRLTRACPPLWRVPARGVARST